MPPPLWRARKEGYENVGDIQIRNPIEQDVQGKDGLYKLIYYAQRNRELSTFQKEKDNAYSNLNTAGYFNTDTPWCWNSIDELKSKGFKT